MGQSPTLLVSPKVSYEPYPTILLVSPKDLDPFFCVWADFCQSREATRSSQRPWAGAFGGRRAGRAWSKELNLNRKP